MIEATNIPTTSSRAILAGGAILACAGDLADGPAASAPAGASPAPDAKLIAAAQAFLALGEDHSTAQYLCLLDTIIDEEARTPAGLAAKARVVVAHFGPQCRHDGWEECLARSIALDVARVLGSA